MRRTLILILLVPLAAPAGTLAADQVEELPPPKQEKSVLVDEVEVSSGPQVTGWALVGPSGRIYCVGATALADYQQDGQRHLAILEAEDSVNCSAPDERFLYFRETNTFHRWAVARNASIDQRYRVYFQAAESRGAWRLFQRAQAIWDEEHDEPAPVLLWNEPTCGEPLLSELLWSMP